jgi:arginyl-tRNA synthetase
MKLKDLIQMVTDQALEQMTKIKVGKDYDEAERQDIAHIVGIAALKFADLVNHYAKDYVFDLERFSSFEGRTGPYLLYTTVRAKSILREASVRGIDIVAIQHPSSQVERSMLLKIAELPDVIDMAWQVRAPSQLCEYAYSYATLFNRFFHQHHILREKDRARQASWLGLMHLSVLVLERVLGILGIAVPERM